MESLKIIVNLSNLKHLDLILICEQHISFLLLKILKQAPKLSSFKIICSKLMLLLDNDELCKYLNKIIKNLNLDSDPILFINDSIGEKFCKVLSNIEKLSCIIDQPHDLLVLLKRLPKLSMIMADFYTPDTSEVLASFEEE
ncbi:unnamed protein product [Adineta steineri]|uniref:Uncharacterized protein n=1 Tax=Adineta steineri TaxID=433720 RepID=A0A820EJ73_9BILA|nr:unnamed protein product [Adineta steineri]CAF0723882.1 unnamed protein product [Adineta steineri]CAF4052184.1 unnamed protein product [Adineta steineri]CAF4246908.1 unnamed protein product [Adineta steineri]